MDEDEERPLVDGGEKEVSSPASTGLALLVTWAFGGAVCVTAGMQWGALCDAPLSPLLLGIGGAVVLMAMVQTTLALQSTPSSGKACVLLLTGAFLVVGVALGVLATRSEQDCSARASVAFSWSQSTTLAVSAVVVLLASAVLGMFGGPVFAVFGNLLGNFLAWLASLFHAAATALSEEGDPNDKPPKRSAAREFALLINHAMVAWFFLYIAIEALREWDLSCDTAIGTYLVVLGFYGVILALSDYVYEKTAGKKRRVLLSPLFPYLWWFNVLAWLAWGSFGAHETYTSTTCRKTAKDSYRLAQLLSFLFLFTLVFLGAVLLLVLLDYLCSGRVRVIMVIEADVKMAPNEDEQEDKK